MATTNPRGDPASAPRDPAGRRPGSVLVADDDLDFREAMADTLADEGWDVTLAEDGAEALEKMRSTDFDAVILDNRMPRLTGCEVYRELLAEGRKVPVVLVTAAAGVEALAASLGIAHYLAKPFDFDALLALLESVGEGAPPG